MVYYARKWHNMMLVATLWLLHVNFTYFKMNISTFMITEYYCFFYDNKYHIIEIKNFKILGAFWSQGGRRGENM